MRFGHAQVRLAHLLLDSATQLRDRIFRLCHSSIRSGDLSRRESVIEERPDGRDTERELIVISGDDGRLRIPVRNRQVHAWCAAGACLRDRRSRSIDRSLGRAQVGPVRERLRDQRG